MELDTNSVGKSFWSRPEGKLGVVVAALLGIGLFLLIGVYVLPLFILSLKNMMHFGALLIATGIVLAVLLDRSFQRNTKALFQLTMRKMTGWVVELDPIGIIMNYLGKLQESLEKMAKQLELLWGQRKKLENKIAANEAKKMEAIKTATFAKKKLEGLDQNSSEYRKIKNMAVIEANQAARIDSSNNNLRVVLDKIIGLINFLEKLYDDSKLVLDDMTNDVEVRKGERDAINTGYSAFEEALKIIDGDKDEKMMYNAGMEFVAEELARKVGTIDRFMNKSGSMFAKMDIEKEMFDMKGFEMIEQWAASGELQLDAGLIKNSLSNTSVVQQYQPQTSSNVDVSNKYL